MERVEDGRTEFLPRREPLVPALAGEVALDGEQAVAEGDPFPGSAGLVLQWLRKDFERFGEVPTRMRPAACLPDSRNDAVAGIPVRLQPARVAREEPYGMLGGARGLIFVQHDGGTVPSGAVQPHVRVRLRVTVRLPKHLQRGLVGLQDPPRQQLPVQRLVEQFEPARTPDHPVRKRLPGQVHAQPGELLLLTLQRHGVGVLLVHDVRDSGRRGQTARKGR